MNCSYIPRGNRSGAEVFEIKSNNRCGAASDSAGENVSILGMIYEQWIEAGSLFDERFGEMPGNFLPPVLGEGRGPVEAFDLGSIRFFKNPYRPSRAVETRALGETQEKVTDPVIGEDAGVDHDSMIYSSHSPV